MMGCHISRIFMPGIMSGQEISGHFKLEHVVQFNAVAHLIQDISPAVRSGVSCMSHVLTASESKGVTYITAFLSCADVLDPTNRGRACGKQLRTERTP